MADTGWVIASSASSDGSNGWGTPWSSTSKVTAEDADPTIAASIPAGEGSQYLVVLFSSLAVPGGSTIDGIEFKAVTLDEFGTYDTAIRAVKSSTIGSTDRSTSTHWSGLASLTWGGAADLWGETWTVAEANAIGVAIECSSLLKFGNSDGIIDAVYARITYTAGGGGGSSSMLGLLGVG